MSILTFIALLFAAMFGAALVGAALELVATPLVFAIPKHKRDELEGIAFINAAGGRRRDRFVVARVAPGIGHVVAGFGILKDLVVFGGLGIANAVIVTRFLQAPERIDWIWYVVAALNATPAMPRHLYRDLSLWLRLLTMTAYVLTCVAL